MFQQAINSFLAYILLRITNLLDAITIWWMILHKVTNRDSAGFFVCVFEHSNVVSVAQAAMLHWLQG